jgi:hypothetical protein
MSLIKLPIDIYTEISLNLSLNDILRNCAINKDFAKICTNDSFWEKYLNIHYGVTNKGIKKNSYKETVFECERIIKLVFNRKSFISTRLLNRMIEKMSEELIIKDINSISRQTLICRSDFLENQDIEPTIKIEYPSSKISELVPLAYNTYPTDITNHHTFKSSDLTIIKKYLYYISLPDTYITPNGIMQIPFNKWNFDKSIEIFRKVLSSFFINYLIKLGQGYAETTYLKYTLFDKIL